jgi:hypothetical protein
LAVQLGSSFGVGKVSSFDALEEAGGELTACSGGKGVEVGIGCETGCMEEEEPAGPDAVGVGVGIFGFGVVDSVVRVSIEEIQEEMALGSGAMRKFGGTWSG